MPALRGSCFLYAWEYLTEKRSEISQLKSYLWSEWIGTGWLTKIEISQSKGISENEFSFANWCLECKNRTVPDLERITIDCVVAPKS